MRIPFDVRHAVAPALGSVALFSATTSAAFGAQLSAPASADPTDEAQLLVERLGLPDFSYAGWEGAADEPPAVTPTTHTSFLVTDFGAVADDGLSDRGAVEAAIAAAEASPGPAAVIFPAGRFVLRDRDDVGAPPIRVTRGDLVIRGAGMFSGGTELLVEAGSHNVYAFDIEPELDPTVSWRGFRDLTSLTEVPSLGQREVTVLDASGIHAGDVVRLSSVLPDTFAEFRSYFGLLGDDDRIQGYFDRSSGDGKDWRSDFLSTLEVESVTGNVVRFTEPLLAEYEFTSPTYKGGPKLVQIFADGEALMERVGVEDVAFVGGFRDTFSHFFNRGMDSFNFLRFANVRQSYVRRVRMQSGTRGIFFNDNGRNNLVYDVQFEGNSGHYSITTDGNTVGNQASFLREYAPCHHGFGATSSAFGTVYHRCNHFAGPEGHGGYPQATLFDCNEGDLSLSRIGGAPPHQARGTVFWNWNQDLMVPTSTGLAGADGRYLAPDLAGAELSFWPDRIMQPSLVGLHGTPATIGGDPDSVEQVVSQGAAVKPQSLFEYQLRRRLGATPRWLMRRALTFEAVTRYSQVDIAAPASETRFTPGAPVTVDVRLHPKFDRQHLASVELLAGQGHPLDEAPQVVASSTDVTVTELVWTPPVDGPWRLTLRLVNSLGEETESEPVYVFVEPSDPAVEFLTATDAWLQPRDLDSVSIMGASDGVVFTDRAQYRSDVLAIERPLVESAVLDAANRQVGQALVDGNLTANATGPAALRFFGIKGLVIDLGSVQRVDFLQLVGPTGSSNIELFSAMDIQVSVLEDSEFSYTGSDLGWHTARRLGHARRSVGLPLGVGRRIRIHLPKDTEARYIRLLVRTLDSTGPNDGNLAELRPGRYTHL